MLRTFMIFSVVALLLCGCGNRAEKQAANDGTQKFFRYVTPPAGMSGQELLSYMQAHYWDKFDFSDTLFISRADTADMLSAYARYIAQYVPADDPTPIGELMKRASVSKPMLGYFAMLGDMVLFDPTSPLRNGELYIPVLETVVNSPYFDQWEKIAPRADLKLVMQNRVGHKANDIKYTLASGSTGRLYSLDADFVLLFISNPECPMCRDIREELSASPMLTEMIERGDMKVLMLYPDEDLVVWRAHISEIPSVWINAYDKGTQIQIDQSYDLRAIPSLYLLDRDKRVLLKDASDIALVEFVVDHFE